MTTRISAAVSKVADALSSVDQSGIDAACRLLAGADSLGVYGCGREGYQMRGFAMRLFHLGLNVGYIGETTMPAIREGGLLIVSSGPGGLSTVKAHMATARSAGASVLLITAQPDLEEARLADIVLAVSAQTMADDGRTGENEILPMGSVYEGALFFLCEWIIADLKAVTGQTAETVRARHTNME